MREANPNGNCVQINGAMLLNAVDAEPVSGVVSAARLPFSLVTFFWASKRKSRFPARDGHKQPISIDQRIIFR